MSILVSFLVDEAYMAQSDAEILATVSCCALLDFLEPLVLHYFQVLEANSVTTLQELSTMPSNNLTTMKWKQYLIRRWWIASMCLSYGPPLRRQIS